MFVVSDALCAVARDVPGQQCADEDEDAARDQNPADVHEDSNEQILFIRIIGISCQRDSNRGDNHPSPDAKQHPRESAATPQHMSELLFSIHGRVLSKAVVCIASLCTPSAL